MHPRHLDNLAYSVYRVCPVVQWGASTATIALRLEPSSLLAKRLAKDAGWHDSHEPQQPGLPANIVGWGTQPPLHGLTQLDILLLYLVTGSDAMVYERLVMSQVLVYPPVEVHSAPPRRQGRDHVCFHPGAVSIDHERWIDEGIGDSGPCMPHRSVSAAPVELCFAACTKTIGSPGLLQATCMLQSTA